MLGVSVHGDTDVGRLRTNNEDAYIVDQIWDDNHWLLVVIDGLGGYEGGEVAAGIAKTTIRSTVDKYQGQNCLDIITQSVVDANNAIYNQRDSEKGLGEMGCVITAAILDLRNKKLNVAHVGDTRLYEFDGERLVKLTHDHSLVGGLEDGGYISETDAMNHPHRNLIERIVGDAIKDEETPHFIEASIFPVSKGHQFLFCSDGLSDVVNSAEISSILREESNPKKKTEALIRLANQKGGKDNITTIVAAIVASPILSQNIPHHQNQKKQNRQIEKDKKKRNRHKKSLHQDIEPGENLEKGKTDYLFYGIVLILTIIAIVFIVLSTKQPL